MEAKGFPRPGEPKEIGPEQWSGMSEEERSDFLQHYRLAYRSDAFVNWCPELGTVWPMTK